MGFSNPYSLEWTLPLYTSETSADLLVGSFPNEPRIKRNGDTNPSPTTESGRLDPGEIPPFRFQIKI